MSEPAIPTLEELGPRHFSFYPAILNTEHNDWVLKELKWSEILVGNVKTGAEIWIPRRYVGEVASVEDPVTILGLTRELEYKAGTVWPRDRRVLKMPANVARTSQEASGGLPLSSPPSFLSRFASGPEMKVGRLVGTVLGVGLIAILIVAGVLFRPVKFQGIEQASLPLTGEDDYAAVVRKVGPPSEDHWRADTGELQYRVLSYKDKPYVLVLMGTERDNARYIGAMNKDWKPVHSVSIPGGADTVSLLRRLRKF